MSPRARAGLVAGYVPLTLECGTGKKTVHGAHVYTDSQQSVHPHAFVVDSDTTSGGTRVVHWTYLHRQTGHNPEYLRLTGKITRTASGAVTADGVASIHYAIGDHTTCGQTRAYALRHVSH